MFFIFTSIAQNKSVEQRVDNFINNAIAEKAFPGCVIQVIHNDSILLNKGYGYFTYDKKKIVSPSDLYDIASITKIAASTLAMMKLYEDGFIHLDSSIGTYIEGLGKVGDVTLREALAHQAGLETWIPYHSRVRKKNNQYFRNTVSPTEKENFDQILSEGLYLHNNFYKKIKKMIKKSNVSEKKEYLYSGLFFYLIPELVEKLTHQKFDDYLASSFYEPMNLKTLTFNPLEHDFDTSQIAPTEIDTFFRMKKIHGVVHDEGAAMMSGVSGNAGLFGNADDLATLGRMWINGGTLEGHKYLEESTLKLFTTTQYPNNANRRALGFDKPLLEFDEVISGISKDADISSYGHSGFTGSLFWCDPANDLIFIFLTNRTFPSRNNRKIYSQNIRPILHQFFYDYIKNEEQ